MACSPRHRWCGHVKAGDTRRKTAQIMLKWRACCLLPARCANGWRRRKPLIPRERRTAWRSCAGQRKHHEYFPSSRLHGSNRNETPNRHLVRKSSADEMGVVGSNPSTRRHYVRLARDTTRIAPSSGHTVHLHLALSSPNTTTLLSRGNSRMRSSIGPSIALLQRYPSMR